MPRCSTASRKGDSGLAIFKSPPWKQQHQSAALVVVEPLEKKQSPECLALALA